MTKKAKVIKRLVSIPKNFTWDEMTTLLKGLGFKEVGKKGGSHKRFMNDDGVPIWLPKPHPENIVKRSYLREVVKVLKAEGLI